MFCIYGSDAPKNECGIMTGTRLVRFTILVTHLRHDAYNSLAGSYIVDDVALREHLGGQESYRNVGIYKPILQESK